MGSNGKIETIADLRQDPANARTHTARGVGMIEEALNEVGAARSIVIDEAGIILAGNATVEAAANAGIERVKVVDADGEELVAVRRTGLTDSAKKRLALYDNRTGELSDWSGEVLARLQQEDEALLAGLFRDDELDALLGDLAGEPTVDPGAQMDRAAELQEKWQVERGQVWEIGRHRIMCGDSTSAEDVGRLMGGEKASGMVTDPPFNVGFDYKTGFNDKKELDEYGTWLWSIISSWENLLVEPWRVFMWQAISTCLHWSEWIPRGYRLFASVKDFVQFRPTAVQYSWDPVLFWDNGFSNVDPVAGKRDYFLSKTSRFVLEDSLGHPCPRPIDVCVYIIGELGERGAILDPFLGSGTTVAACEQTGRIGYGMEIEPKYCAVTLERLTGMGLSATLVT